MQRLDSETTGQGTHGSYYTTMQVFTCLHVSITVTFVSQLLFSLLSSDELLGHAARGSPFLAIGPHTTRASRNRSTDTERRREKRQQASWSMSLGEAGLLKGENNPTEIGEFPPARSA